MQVRLCGVAQGVSGTQRYLKKGEEGEGRLSARLALLEGP